MTVIPTDANWHRDANTAVCACSHVLALHALHADGKRRECSAKGCDCRSPR